MKKFEDENEAVLIGEMIYGDSDWAVIENDDATFSVTPPLTDTPLYQRCYLILKPGATGRIESIFGIRYYTIVERDCELYFRITREEE